MKKTDIEQKPPHYLINEFWGGLASMLVALPSAIAFGVLVYSSINPEFCWRGGTGGDDRCSGTWNHCPIGG